VSESVAPYMIVRPYASESQIALARRYSTLLGAWQDLQPGFVVRDAVGVIVAFHETVQNFAEWKLTR
jgi:hypothetical protein